MDIIIEGLGWIGAIMVLAAYALLSGKKLVSDSYTYHGINMVGSFFLVLYASWKVAWANVLVNVVWLVIGIIAVWTLWKSGRRWRNR
ncbi:MAG: hypothetical protein U1E36_05080 [Rickettsiales bacterium]